MVRKQHSDNKVKRVSVSRGAELDKLTHDLVERIKELNCLYGISRLIENGDRTIDEILQGVADLIPPAWQHPEVTCACIRLKDRIIQTANFRQTGWEQLETIHVNAKPVGTLEIYYLEERPPAYEGPFLREELDLIHVIAERLGQIIEHRIAERNVHSLYEREKRLRQQLQSEMKRRIDFSRKLIHELKTPLTSLVATSQLLLEETRGTRLEKVAGYVWEGANNLNNRIEELHDVIKGEIGKLKLKLEPLNLSQLLSSIVDETRALAQQQGVSFHLELDEPLPGVRADAERLKQVMLNLINNALIYAAEGKKITIKASKGIDSVIVEVRDYGPGIPRDKQKLLFRPGYQLVDLDEQRGGLGIGLTLSKTLIELHGGRIWFKSKAGKGSSFFFTIPLKS